MNYNINASINLSLNEIEHNYNTINSQEKQQFSLLIIQQTSLMPLFFTLSL